MFSVQGSRVYLTVARALSLDGAAVSFFVMSATRHDPATAALRLLFVCVWSSVRL